MAYLGSTDIVAHVLDSNNPHDTSVAKLTDVDFTGSPALAADDVLKFNGTSWVNVPATSVGVTDHGALSGLGDDDHSQYHNDTRGDARYYTQTQLNNGQLDTRYYTESEIDIMLGGQNQLSEMTDVTLTAPAAGEVLVLSGSPLTWINQTLAEAGISAVGHTHVKADITDFNEGDYAAASHNHDLVYAPISHTHVMADITDSTWISGVVWGDITGTLSSQTDLQNALDAKATAPTTYGVPTTNATPTTLATIAIPTGEQKILDIKVHGNEVATGDHIWKRMTLGVKNIAGTASIVGGVDSATGYDAGASTWTIAASVSSGNVVVTVTGEALHEIDWRATLEID